jgi:hypothetical protein
MSEEQLSMEKAAEQVIEKKRTAWGNLGVAIYHAETDLQLKQQLIEKTLIAPTKIEDIPKAEETLKLAKQGVGDLETARKLITGKFKDVTERLMKPEKSVELKINAFTAELIKLKRLADEEAKKQEQKNNELKAIAAKVRLYIAEINASYLKEHAKLLNDSYVYALEKVPPEKLDEYKAKLKARITIANRTMVPPAYTATYATKEEVDAEIAKVFNPIPAAEYVQGFENDLNLKYADYKLAWENKPQALKLNEQENADNQTAIEQQKTQDTVAANIQALAQTPTIGLANTKPLKNVYKLAMQETFNDANIIITAYLANNQKCFGKLSITKWLSGFGVKQMIGALEKLKNEDEKFNFDGLVWTTEDKL